MTTYLLNPYLRFEIAGEYTCIRHLSQISANLAARIERNPESNKECKFEPLIVADKRCFTLLALDIN